MEQSFCISDVQTFMKTKRCKLSYIDNFSTNVFQSGTPNTEYLECRIFRKIFSNECKYNFENMYDNNAFVKQKQLVHWWVPQLAQKLDVYHCFHKDVNLNVHLINLWITYSAFVIISVICSQLSRYTPLNISSSFMKR